MMEQFHWTSPRNVEVVLPHMGKVGAGIIRRHRKSDPVDFIFSVLEEVADKEMLARADSLSVDEINDLFDKWQEAGASVGICGLLDLIEEHRAPLEYDFRARFHLPLRAIPNDVGWDEALRLVRIIRSDPSSALAAAFEGWEHPVSRTEAILMDLWDVTQAAGGFKKQATYPRPWKKARPVEKHGNLSLAPAELMKRLAALRTPARS